MVLVADAGYSLPHSSQSPRGRYIFLFNVKYLARYKTKGGVQDLKKAEQYLEWLIEHEENNHE
ncbi:DUF3310 domain-containing protein [uncultured Cardiobacterium sp.]|uniref:DUF3310 domain-containing protein n=1 Tax=uncultured Cardiobacterium sp. TaxID=417619 RepID=UPI003454600D